LLPGTIVSDIELSGSLAPQRPETSGALGIERDQEGTDEEIRRMEETSKDKEKEVLEMK
jgi:hypothetical protein